MNSSALRGGIATAALVLATGTVASFSAQEGATPQTGRPTETSQQGEFNQQGMQEIEDAYLQLHEATQNALQEKARTWKEAGLPTPSTEDSDAARDIGATSASSPISLRAEELLIVACSEGLLAGAPISELTSGLGSTETSQDDIDFRQGLDELDQQGRTGLDDPAAATIGMILMCAHSVDASSDLRGVSFTNGSANRSDAETRAASSPTSPSRLEPGVYCVKQSGQLVWLVDEAGEVVLQTTVTAELSAATRATPTTPKSGDPRANDPTDSGRASDDPTGAPSEGMEGMDGMEDMEGMEGMGAESEWEEVFDAIAKEAKRSMGWAKNGASSLLR